MALDSTSTHAQATAQLNDNLSYEGSVGKTTSYIEAVRWLQANRPETSADSGTSFTFGQLQGMLDRALNHRDAISRTNRAPFVRGRPL
ncbi:MAG: hypothetical protein ACPGWS_05350 [Solirubrobacterales bacterium]